MSYEPSYQEYVDLCSQQAIEPLSEDDMWLDDYVEICNKLNYDGNYP